MTKATDKNDKKPAAEKAIEKASDDKSRIDSAMVRQLATVLNDTGLTEIEYESGGLRIRVARGGQVMAGQTPFMMQAAAPAAVAAVAAVEPLPADHPGAVKSPMVGVAYLQPEPGAASFIKVGDQVTEGQTLLLVEAMKTFNPVKAPRAGKITSILVETGAPVEYGEPLVIIG